MGLMRVVNGQSVDAAFVRHVIDTLILPAVHAIAVQSSTCGLGIRECRIKRELLCRLD